MLSPKSFAWVVVILALAGSAFGATCDQTAPAGVACTFFTPTLSCGSYNFTAYNSSNAVLYGNLNALNASAGLYTFDLNLSRAGVYNVVLCDGSTKTVTVGGDTMSLLAISALFGIAIFSLLTIPKLFEGEGENVVKWIRHLLALLVFALLPVVVSTAHHIAIDSGYTTIEPLLEKVYWVVVVLFVVMFFVYFLLLGRMVVMGASELVDKFHGRKNGGRP